MALVALGCVDAEPAAERDASEPVARARSAISVEQAVATSCSTESVKGLSLQIIAQANCIEPGAFSEIPEQPNVTMASAVFPYLEAPARDAFVAAVSANPNTPLTINSMLRTVAQQLLLYRWYQQGTCGIGLAATPGSSNHETGLAFDTSQFATWRPAFEQAGFAWFGSADSVHFDYAGPGAVDEKGLDVLAFQTLWNANHADDPIAADGAYGPETEARLLASPAEGFPRPVSCAGPSARADIHLTLELEADDVFSDGASLDVGDLFEGEATTLTFRLENKGGAAAGSVAIALDLDDASFTLDGYAITHAPDLAGPYEPDPAGALPENPQPPELEAPLELELGPFAVAEHKRITLVLTPVAYSVDEPAPRVLQAWVTHVDALYSQADFGGEVANTEGSQTFGGGRLELEAPADVYARTRWEWQTDRREGATASAGSATKLAQGAFHIEGGDASALLLLPESDLGSGSARGVRLRARRAGGEGRALLVVRRGDEALADAERFDLDLPSGDAFAELVVDIGDGPVRQLAIIPFDGAAGAADFDFVRIEPSAQVGSEAPKKTGCDCRSATRGGSLPPVRLLAAAFAVAALLARRSRRRP